MRLLKQRHDRLHLHPFVEQQRPECKYSYGVVAWCLPFPWACRWRCLLRTGRHSRVTRQRASTKWPDDVILFSYSTVRRRLYGVFILSLFKLLLRKARVGTQVIGPLDERSTLKRKPPPVAFFSYLPSPVIF